MNLKYYRFY